MPEPFQQFDYSDALSKAGLMPKKRHAVAEDPEPEPEPSDPPRPPGLPPDGEKESEPVPASLHVKPYCHWCERDFVATDSTKLIGRHTFHTACAVSWAENERKLDAILSRD